MKTNIKVKDWIRSYNESSNFTWKNKLTGEVISEQYSKEKKCFEYFDKNHEYIGHYNSDISLFNDDLILIVLDSKY